ncbi:MAG TPA: TadE/TadG family type IV pilus assembly protein [Acidimicrobiia bacterium]
MGKPGLGERGWRSTRYVGSRSADCGAALFEFAMIMPLIVLLILSVIEFGWLFAQMNELRHMAQEGARWGAVSRPDVDGSGTENWADIGARACDAANLPGGSIVTVTGSEGGGAKGDTASITVTANVQSLSNLGIITVFLPSTLTNTETFRLEQPAKWTGGTTTC